MIRGTVNSRNEAVIPLRLRGPSGAECDVDVVVDTGFTGVLTLPATIITALGLPPHSGGEMKLGDGTSCKFDTDEVEIEWDGVWLTHRATEIEAEPLLGMGLLAGHEVFIEFVPGGVVDVTKLP